MSAHPLPPVDDSQPEVQRSRSGEFKRLVGRESASDLSDLSQCSVEDIIAIKQIPQSLVEEVRETEARRRAGVFDPEKEYADAMVHFQQCAFDPRLRGVKSARWESGRVSSSKGTGSKGAFANQAASDFDRLFDGQTSSVAGLHVVHAEKCDGPRPRTPWWILNERVYHEFLRRLVDEKSHSEIEFLQGKELLKAAGLDHAILSSFYFLRKEDDEIFQDFGALFRTEAGKQRVTSSAAAVKMRRTRLVKEGNAIFGPGARPAEGPERQEHLAFWADIRQRPPLERESPVNIVVLLLSTTY